MKWLGLIVLASFVSLIEALTAVVIFALLAIIMSPDAPIVVPLLGDIKELIPSLTQRQGLRLAGVIAGAFFLARAVLYFVQSYLQNRLAYGTGALLAKRLIRGYLTMPYVRYTNRNSADLIRNAHESSVTLASWVLFPGIVLAAEAFVIVALSIVLIATSPKVALGAFAVMGILVVALLKIVQPRLQATGLAVQELTSASLKSIQQTLHGLRDIRLLGREEFFEQDFARTREDLSRGYALRGLLIDVPRISLETSVLLIVVLFVVIQAIDTDRAGTEFTALGMFGYAALRVLPSVNRIVNNLQSLRFSVPLIDFLYQDVVEADAVVSDPPSSQSQGRFNTLNLRDVSFRYPEASRDAVAHIDLTIARGESLGVVGQTGSGKSTLLDLMVGLLDPSEGQVLVDGRPMQQVRKGWQKQIAVVSQSVFLIDDTIKNNIALGQAREELDETAFAQAVQAAQLQDFVATLPKGSDTLVGEHGVRLSGGQRQRIAIARALYRRPSVLVLDEGTSALDNRTESLVLSSLSELGDELTLINVAHRVSTVRMCDRLILISEGRIADSGPYDELIARNKEFESLTRSQFQP